MGLGTREKKRREEKQILLCEVSLRSTSEPIDGKTEKDRNTGLPEYREKQKTTGLPEDRNTDYVHGLCSVGPWNAVHGHGETASRTK